MKLHNLFLSLSIYIYICVVHSIKSIYIYIYISKKETHVNNKLGKTRQQLLGASPPSQKKEHVHGLVYLSIHIHLSIEPSAYAYVY